MNLVFIVIDCLRKDIITGKNNTPNMRRFIKENVSFDKAYAHSSWTKTSIASLFTSKLPARHKVYNISSVLPRNFKTLAEVLKINGYKTICLTSNVYFIDQAGLERGFDEVEFFKDTDGEYINKELKKKINTINKSPFFFYLHYMDTHLPFRPHGDESYKYFRLDEDPKELNNLIDKNPEKKNKIKKLYNEHIKLVSKTEEKLPEKELDFETERRLKELGYM
jgi:arylsulfatase A-like enzyme